MWNFDFPTTYTVVSDVSYSQTAARTVSQGTFTVKDWNTSAVISTSMHTDTLIPDANVLPNLNLGHSVDDLIELGDSYSGTQKIKLFAGYAGWSPGQLEDEMKRKAWLTHPGSLELVFDTSPDQLWQMILHRKGWKYKLLAQMPEDLSSN